MQFIETPREIFGKRLLEMTVPSQLSLKTPLVFRMIKELKENGCLPWTGSHRAELCFDEALTNAMMHGNRFDPQRRIRVEIYSDGARWGVTVQDEGEGFGPENVPNPSDEQFLFRESGRGIMLMDSWLDELSYCRPSRTLYMVRKCQTEPEAVEAAAALEGEQTPPAAMGPVEVTKDGDIDVVRLLSTRLTDENADVVRAAVMEQTGKNLLLDMSLVEYVSSVGLSTMVGLYKAVKARQGKMALSCMQPGVTDIFRSAHLLALFTVSPDRATAVKGMKS